MGLRVINTVEKNVVPKPSQLFVIPANTPVLVLPSIAGDFEEYAGRYIQNVQQGIAYYNFSSGSLAGSVNAVTGQPIDNTKPVGINAQQFSGVLAGAAAVDTAGYGSGQQLDVSNFPGDVWVYSLAGTTIAVTVLIRKDLIKGGNIL